MKNKTLIVIIFSTPIITSEYHKLPDCETRCYVQNTFTMPYMDGNNPKYFVNKIAQQNLSDSG